MRQFPVSKGQDISFTYVKPNGAMEQRSGKIDRIRRAEKTRTKLIVFTLMDDDAKDWRSFHYNRMTNMMVKV
jgi:hypothetical protein